MAGDQASKAADNGEQKGQKKGGFLSKVPKPVLYLGGAVLAYLGYRWYQNRQSSSAATTAATPPASGTDTGSGGGGGFGGWSPSQWTQGPGPSGGTGSGTTTTNNTTTTTTTNNYFPTTGGSSSSSAPTAPAAAATHPAANNVQTVTPVSTPGAASQPIKITTTNPSNPLAVEQLTTPQGATATAQPVTPGGEELLSVHSMPSAATAAKTTPTGKTVTPKTPASTAANNKGRITENV